MDETTSVVAHAEFPKHYGSDPVRFSGHPDALLERHLLFNDLIDPRFAGARQTFEAAARSVRDVLSKRWSLTSGTYHRENPKRIYYLSMEFLIGRSLTNNITNLMLDRYVEGAAREANLDWLGLLEQEPDAGLGNGGLGRLAACFLEFDGDDAAAGDRVWPALRVRHVPAGDRERLAARISRQLAAPSGSVGGGAPQRSRGGQARLLVRDAPGQDGAGRRPPLDADRRSPSIGRSVGFGGKTINMLRLWKAAAHDYFDFKEFSGGDFVGALVGRIAASTLTRVLYPDNSTEMGQELRFTQEYFLVACSLADLVRRFRRDNTDWNAFPDKVAIQLNDTHPTLAVPELMRILLDEAGFGWDAAWDITQRTLAYTNHTLLPEALERWPLHYFQQIVPRQLEIIFEINRRFLDDVRRRYPNDEARVARMSLIEEGPEDKVRMANLAIVGSHSTNGVAAIHSQLLRATTVKDFAEMFPERFNNKTNGVTPRRWLLMANPALSNVISDAIGDGWTTDFSEIAGLKWLAGDAAFRADFLRAKREAKSQFSDWLQSTCGQIVDPDSIFDCQVKRIHEYKRQMLNALRVVVLYNRMKAHPELDVMPRIFFFAGKAAPAYRLAKLIIKFLNNLADTIAADPVVRDRLKVVFLPEYCVSLAERLIPAADMSNQISTAGYEASGTSNLKFMMNGALTIGTRDGATIEMAEEAGEDNFFLFGLSAQEVAESCGWYSPYWHYEHEPETRAALDMISGDAFSRGEPGIFAPLRDALLTHGDHYMHLADLRSYLEADQAACALYRDRDEWARKAILNVAGSGKFSSDRTIAQYAAEIWHAKPCPVG